MSSNPRNGRDLRPVVSQTLKSFYLFSTNFGLDYFPLNLMVTCSSSGCFHNKERYANRRHFQEFDISGTGTKFLHGKNMEQKSSESAFV